VSWTIKYRVLKLKADASNWLISRQQQWKLLLVKIEGHHFEIT